MTVKPWSVLPEITQLAQVACAHSQVIGPLPQVDWAHIPPIVPPTLTEQTWPDVQLIALGRPAQWTAPQAVLCRRQLACGPPSFWHVATVRPAPAQSS